MIAYQQAGGPEREDSGCPLVAFDAFVLRRTLCAMTLYYLESPEQLPVGDHSLLHLVLTPEMAKRLAKALEEIAGQAEQDSAVH